MQIWNIPYSFTRPVDTAVYASGDLVANSTTAGSVVPLSWALGNSAGVAHFRMTRIRISKTGTSVSGATFRVHFYDALPAVTNGDNGVWLSTLAASYLGNIDVAVAYAMSDGAAGFGAAPAGSEMLIRAQSGKTLYALMEARGAYTPASAEVFTVSIEELEAY